MSKKSLKSAHSLVKTEINVKALFLSEWLLCSLRFLREVDEFLSTPGRWTGQHWCLPQCQDCLDLNKSLWKGHSKARLPSWAPLCAHGRAATFWLLAQISQPQLRQTEWDGPSPVLTFFNLFFFNPTVWHWSCHFCCKFLIDDSLSGSTLSQLWGSWSYPYIIYFICKCFINIQALVVSWGSQCASVISVEKSSFGCVKENFSKLF